MSEIFFNGTIDNQKKNSTCQVSQMFLHVFIYMESASKPHNRFKKYIHLIARFVLYSRFYVYSICTLFILNAGATKLMKAKLVNILSYFYNFLSSYFCLELALL